MEIPKLTRCIECKSERLRSDLVSATRSVGKHAWSAMVRAQVCEQCGEVYYEGPELLRLNRAVAILLVEGGVVSPEAFKFLRKMAELTAAELADLLAVDPATVSRWENERHAIDRATMNAVWDLALDKIYQRRSTSDRLTYASKPAPEGRVLEIDVARIEEKSGL